MDKIRFGRGVRAIRLRRGWRQADLAAAARLGRSVVARIERGLGDTVPPRKLEATAIALGARVELRLSWNGEALDRLLDRAHARLVDQLAGTLRLAGWDVVAEVTFLIRGERGSVDLLAWHAETRLVLVIEVKSVVPDIQSMLAALDRKVRLAPLIARDRGWAPVAVAKLLVMGETRTSRRRVEAFAETFRVTFPDRGAGVRRWIRAPAASAPLRGLLFLSSAQGLTTRHRASSHTRRRPT
jgi:transcriptional regulator with XRE-family HTH domain